MTSGFRRAKVPGSSSEAVSCAHSSSDPAHQWTESGWVSLATSVTHARMPWWVVGAVSFLVGVCVSIVAVMTVSFSVRSGWFARPRCRRLAGTLARGDGRTYWIDHRGVTCLSLLSRMPTGLREPLSEGPTGGSADGGVGVDAAGLGTPVARREPV